MRALLGAIARLGQYRGVMHSNAYAMAIAFGAARLRLHTPNKSSVRSNATGPKLDCLLGKSDMQKPRAGASDEIAASSTKKENIKT